MSNIELQPLVHMPIRQPRAYTPGEGVFLELWRDLLAARPAMLEEIFSDLPFNTDQRAASVAATFMVWMGCNCGREFTHTAESYAKSGAFPNRCYAFLAAWANTDIRRRGVNSGLRASEFLLAAEHPLDERAFTHGRVRWELVPDVQMRDRDVLEAMVLWWASAEAGRLRTAAGPLIAQRLLPQEPAQLPILDRRA